MLDFVAYYFKLSIGLSLVLVLLMLIAFYVLYLRKSIFYQKHFSQYKNVKVFKPHNVTSYFMGIAMEYNKTILAGKPLMYPEVNAVQHEQKD